MNRKDLTKLIKEVKGEKDFNLIREGGFSRLRQIMLGQVPVIDTVGIITAENPGGKAAPIPQNKKNNKKLMGQLRSKNYGPIKVRGKFGEKENSFMVPLMTREDVIELGQEYGQEAVIWGEKLEDDDGNPYFRFEYIEFVKDEDGNHIASETVETRDVSLGGAEAQEREDFYSEKAGRKFYIPFFDDDYETARSEEGGRRVSFMESELPVTKEVAFLITHIQDGALSLQENTRTGKSMWHHRGVMRAHMRRLQSIVDYHASKQDEV